jgi:hypothetical protein
MMRSKHIHAATIYFITWQALPEQFLTPETGGFYVTSLLSKCGCLRPRGLFFYAIVPGNVFTPNYSERIGYQAQFCKKCRWRPLKNELIEIMYF